MKRILTYLCSAVLLISSCKRHDKFPDVQLFGHAADGLDMSTAPYQENTAEAIDYALSYPEMAGVEIDIQWSKDGTIWLFHDELLEEETTGEGCIREKTDTELDEVHFKGITNEKIVRLNDQATKFTNRKVILDFKIYGNCGVALTNTEIENSFIAFNNLISNTEVSVVMQDLSFTSFFETLGWKVFLEVQSSNDYVNQINSAYSSGCCIRNTLISKEEIQQIQSLGKEVIIFGAKAPKPIRKALKKTPNIFLADDIKTTLIEKIK